MRELCRDCAHYCISCYICSVDKEYHDINDSCRDFSPEGGTEEDKESDVSDDDSYAAQIEMRIYPDK